MVILFEGSKRWPIPAHITSPKANPKRIGPRAEHEHAKLIMCDTLPHTNPTHNQATQVNATTGLEMIHSL